MKSTVFRILLFLSFLFAYSAQAQMQHCCDNNKKVKIKKQRKRSKGALVGVKGHSDKKATKARMKEIKNKAKARRKEIKASSSNDEIEEAIVPVDTLGIE